MDTSEQYIKMCKEAKEIQVRWRPAEGDYYFVKGTKDMIKILNHTGFAMFPVCVNYIWLPRQDQLQDMIDISFNYIWNYFVSAIEKYPAPAYNDFIESMEQLWLAFCMSEKFNKIWDGESWIVKK